MTDLAQVLSVTRAALARGDQFGLLSDYDGTLTPIVTDPDEAHLDEAVRNTLQTLAGAPRFLVGIVSGRSLQDVRTRVGVPGLVYAGCHGLEVEGPDLRFIHPGACALQEAFATLARALTYRLAAVPGVRVEPKGFAVAVHVRNVDPEDVPAVEAEVAHVLGPRRDLTLLRGRKVVEIVPAGNWDKGRCALWIREHLATTSGRKVSVLYLGDDTTDETAFWALRRTGVTVRVGRRGPTCARFRLGDVDDVHRLLAALAEDLGATGAA